MKYPRRVQNEIVQNEIVSGLIAAQM